MAAFKQHCFIVFTFLVLFLPAYQAQSYFVHQIDSLENSIQRSKNPKEKNLLWAKQLNLAARLEDSTIFLNLKKKLINISKSPEHKEVMTSVYQSSGILYYYQGDFGKAFKYFDSACVFARKNNFEELLMAALMSRGAMRYTQQDYYNSLLDYLESEKLMLKYKSDKLGGLYSNISMIYNNVGDLQQAEKYLKLAIPFTRAANDKEGLVKAFNNLALIEKKRKNYFRADSIFREGLKLAQEYNLERDISDLLYNLSDVMALLNKKDEAIALRLELFEVVKKTGETNWQKIIALDLATDYYGKGNLTKTLEYLKLSKSIEWNEDAVAGQRNDYYSGVASLALQLKDYKTAAESYAEAYKLKLLQEKEASLLDLKKINYEHEKQKDSLEFAKQKEINDLNNEKERQKTEHKLSQQRIMTAISIVVLIIIGFFSISLFRTNRQKEAANKEILQQKQLITAKNKEITDSINYAQRIQHSLLPTTQTISRFLPQHFLIYLPKDIVSGDFYWLKEINSNEFFVAVADCTGHGVPGSIMSALSIQQLNEISETVNEPGEILNKLNKKIKENLNQDEEGFSKDGLDIAMCKINLAEKKLYYSGANRALWLFDKNGLKQEIKATKAGIAGHTGNEQVYVQHVVNLLPNELFVLSTDGYADQFGGEKMKKITTKRFKALITESLNNSAPQTGEFLKDNFFRWKNTLEQIDDVCVLGFKFV